MFQMNHSINFIFLTLNFQSSIQDKEQTCFLVHKKQLKGSLPLQPCARAPSVNLSRKARLSRVHREEVELAKGVRGD